MAVVRWDPWKELAGIERQFEELVGRFGSAGRSGERTWAPSVDVHQDGETLVIRAEVAGVDPGDIDITVDDDVLTIAGRREQDRSVEEGQWIRRERMSGEFRRSISLPPGTDAARISAKATNGVIEVRVPRAEHPEPRRIPLQASASGERIDVESGRGETGGTTGSARSRSPKSESGNDESGKSESGKSASAKTGRASKQSDASATGVQPGS